MKVTLDFNEKQSKVFKEFLRTGFVSLQEQKKTLEDIIHSIPMEKVAEIKNVNDYLCEIVIPQQLLVAEIIQSIEEAEKPLIITQDRKIYV